LEKGDFYPPNFSFSKKINKKGSIFELGR